jgi:hypothetical protein
MASRGVREPSTNIIYFLGIALGGYQAMLWLGRQGIESVRRVWGVQSGNPGAARIAGRQRSRSGKKVIERIK